MHNSALLRSLLSLLLILALCATVAAPAVARARGCSATAKAAKQLHQPFGVGAGRKIR